MAYWIWKFGDYEKYHNILVHSSRQAYGHIEPPVWKIYRPECSVRFTRKISTKGGKINIYACGDYVVSLFKEGFGGNEPGNDEIKCGNPETLEIPEGEFMIEIRVLNNKTFPSVYVEGVVETDDKWMADDLSGIAEPVGFYRELNSGLEKPDVFRFEYREEKPAASYCCMPVCGTRNMEDPLSEKLESFYTEGCLYDFGRELFGVAELENAGEVPVMVSFGESKAEALDLKWSVVRFRKVPENGHLRLPASAFRYVWVSDPEVELRVEAEMLPLIYRGNFSSDRTMMDKIWKTAAYTFHLNSREFFLDGIKRDRWVWSADVYQSLFVDHYLFMDQNLEKRTLTALAGGLPVVSYINTIMDYTFMWVISIWEYYRTYGDRKFLGQIYPQLSAHVEFCEGRRDDDGFIRGKNGDWVFIDWCPMDKTGAVCGEQILLAEMMDCYAKIGRTLNVEETEQWEEKASELRAKIEEKFYRDSLGAYIDSFESGRENVTRQNNLLAYLYLKLPEERKHKIYRNVICNDNVQPITTPYFKFYENKVMCLEGDYVPCLERILDYYGGMIRLGATTLYEQYDPEEEGTEHYAMYGRPYGKSLCHAWSASVIYIIGRFILGVKNTGIAYESFEVQPRAGIFRNYRGSVPLPKGVIDIEITEGRVKVRTECSGGTLILGENTRRIVPGEWIECEITM